MPNPANAQSSSIISAINPASGTQQYGGDTSNTTTPGQYTGPFASSSFLGAPFAIYLGMILLLVLFKFLSEHNDIPLEPADLHIGPYNLLAVTVTAMVGITTVKVLANKFPVPGLIQVANFV